MVLNADTRVLLSDMDSRTTVELICDLIEYQQISRSAVIDAFRS